MCGFYFEECKNSIKKSKLQISNLKQILNNRGPDSFNHINENKLFIAFSRLSIQDMNNRANQPFMDKNKKYYLIFNGELYNFIKLRDELKNQGIKFYTRSDTEVLFNLLILKGIKHTLSVIEGMFSFVFIDKQKKIIYGARDHFGQKPLYYSKSKNNFLASTNIKAILENLNYKTQKLDQESVKQYFYSSGIISPSKTFFKNISSLPAGTYFELKKDNFECKKYFNCWDLIDKKLISIYKKKSDIELLKILDTKMINAIKKHIISDAKIGITCSGGIDSSLIFYYVKKIKKDFKVFVNKSRGIEKLSQIVLKISKINNFKKEKVFFINQYKKEYFKGLCELTKYNLFPARWGGGPPMKKLCKIASKKKIKVLIGGDGVDEYFCGYNTFEKIIKNKNEKNNLHQILKIKNISGVQKKFYSPILNSRRKILRKISFIKNKNEKNLIINSLLDIEFFLQSCTLPHSDEYSMSESIELRSPFLDMDLVKFCLNLPLKYKVNKINDFINKYLFRKLAIRNYGNFIDKKKEGTRNFSRFISNKEFYNFKKFTILKKVKLDNRLSEKEIFKLVNLEILQRILDKKSENIENIFTRKGVQKLL